MHGRVRRELCQQAGLRGTGRRPEQPEEDPGHIPGLLGELRPDGTATFRGRKTGLGSTQQQQIGTSRLYISGSGAGGNYLYYSGSGTAPVLTTSESFSYRTTDINIDVTSQIRIWLSGSNNNTIPNYGFLIQLSDSDEVNNNVQGYIRYFSRETHTIYVPKLTMYWDNSAFTTGSMSAVNLESFAIYTNVKPAYKDTEISKIRIYSRDKYPRKSPTNLFPIETVNYLPTTTYYSILDAATDEVIIPYDNI